MAEALGEGGGALVDGEAGRFLAGDVAQDSVDHAGCVRVAAGAREFDALVERSVRGDAVEVDELEGAEAERDGDSIGEALIGALEEGLNAGVEGDLTAEGAKDKRRGEVAVFGRELCGVRRVEEIVAVALPCCDEGEDVKRGEARGRDGLWLVCGFSQAASSCLRILFWMGRPSDVPQSREA